MRLKQQLFRDAVLTMAVAVRTSAVVALAVASIGSLLRPARADDPRNDYAQLRQDIEELEQDERDLGWTRPRRTSALASKEALVPPSPDESQIRSVLDGDTLDDD